MVGRMMAFGGGKKEEETYKIRTSGIARGR
jgi:hypothetical protein